MNLISKLFGQDQEPTEQDQLFTELEQAKQDLAQAEFNYHHADPDLEAIVFQELEIAQKRFQVALKKCQLFQIAG